VIDEAGLAARKAMATAAFVAREIAFERWRDAGANDACARAWRSREAARSMCKMHAIEARVEGVVPRRTAVLVANHVSYIDPLVVGALVACLGIAKAEVAEWPLVGARLRDLGVLFVRRGNAWSGARALRAALAALRRGASVLNFPEGTTTRGDVVLPFRRGIFGVAMRAGVPVVPVRIDYDDPRMAWVGNETLLPHYMMMAGRASVTARVRFGAPLAPAKRPEDLAEAARETIARV